MKTYLTYDNQLRSETDPAIIANLERKGWLVTEPPVVAEVPPTYTAEAWLEAQGYGAMRLLGLLDLESKFGQQSPPKMQAVRTWINSIRAQYAETKSDWQPAPHNFEATMQEIAQWQTN